ncbi:hypothetical protein [Piscinibacter sakaiensis]|uniref:hypothetical protein n=1 Tax=Piscinibacter sakaiensis TaxID=1547922 RepID=UPI003AAAED19
MAIVIGSAGGLGEASEVFAENRQLKAKTMIGRTVISGGSLSIGISGGKRHMQKLIVRNIGQGNKVRQELGVPASDVGFDGAIG